MNYPGRVYYNDPATTLSVYTDYDQSTGNLALCYYQLFPQRPITEREIIERSQIVHEGICRLISVSINEMQLGQVGVKLTCEEVAHTLSDEIIHRAQVNRPWSDVELLYVLRRFTSALSHIEGEGKAHSDINPSTIFYARGELKVSNPSAAMMTKGTANQVFLSPELKHAVAGAKYDAVKADVYSLGATLLAMAYLQLPPNQNLEQCAAASLGSYSKASSYLLKMLATDPRQRPTFLNLEGYFQDMEQKYVEMSLRIRPAQVDYSNFRPKVCVVCSNRFAENPRYPGSSFCSIECYSLARAHSTCAMCGKVIADQKWAGSLPAGLNKSKEFAVNCCSLACLQQFDSLSDTDRYSGLKRTVKSVASSAFALILSQGAKRVLPAACGPAASAASAAIMASQMVPWGQVIPAAANAMFDWAADAYPPVLRLVPTASQVIDYFNPQQ